MTASKLNLIQQALQRDAKNLSEFESKQVLAAYGIPVTFEKTVHTIEDAVAAAESIGYPVVLKGSGEEIRHKTEMDLIVPDLQDAQQVQNAYQDLTSRGPQSMKHVLVQQMVKGNRELMAGLKRDSQFGPCVMFGLGGVLTEILEDISIRVAPLTRSDAMDMMDDIRGKKILDEFRGKPPVDREALADILLALGKIGLENEAILEIDINPIKLIDGRPVAVDALIILK